MFIVLVFASQVLKSETKALKGDETYGSWGQLWKTTNQKEHLNLDKNVSLLSLSNLINKS